MNDRQNPISTLAERMPPVGEGQVAIAVARAHINSSVSAYAKIAEVANSARNNRTLNEAGQKVAAGKAVKRVTAEHVSNLAQADERLTEEMEAVEARLQAVERPSPEDAWLTPILAQHILGLSKSERIALLAEVGSAADIAPLRIMLTLPTTLSGLPQERLQAARSVLHQLMAPNELQHKKSLQEAQGVIQAARSMFDNAVQQHYTQEVASLIEMAKTAEAA